VYDQKYSLETSLEEIRILGLSPLNNNDLSGITLPRRDKTHPNIIHPMPHNG